MQSGLYKIQINLLYSKKKHYLCSMKARTAVNIFLGIVVFILLNLVILRVLLRIFNLA